MQRNLRYSVWYMITLSGVIFTITILMTIQGAPAWGWVVAITLAVLQLAGLVYYLHCDPRKKKPTLLKMFLHMLQLSVIGVVAWLALAIYSLASQYHNMVIPTSVTASKDNITITETDQLYILYPEYNSIEFVTNNRPSRSNDSITYCSGATFQQRYNLSFTRDELAGKHVENGQLYKGYEKGGLGAFTFYEGTFHFANENEASAELIKASENNGCGFQQFLIIDNGEIILEPANEYRCYRVLAELDSKLCIIDSKKQIDFHDFAIAVHELGVVHAIYMDMGSGWNYSWYRDNEGKASTLIGLPWPFSHNWITFTK